MLTVSLEEVQLQSGLHTEVELIRKLPKGSKDIRPALYPHLEDELALEMDTNYNSFSLRPAPP